LLQQNPPVLNWVYRIMAVQQLNSCWDGRPFGHNRHGPKSGGGCCARPCIEVGTWVQSNRMSPGSKPTSIPSGILIHPTI